MLHGSHRDTPTDTPGPHVDVAVHRSVHPRGARQHTSLACIFFGVHNLDLIPSPIYWLGDTDGSNWRQIDLPDGAALIEWLMANGRAPIDWPHLAVNGDIVLRFGDDGSIKRYVAPE